MSTKKQKLNVKEMFVAIKKDFLGSLGSSDGYQYDSIESAVLNAVSDLECCEGEEIVIAKVTVENPVAYKVETKPFLVGKLDFSQD